MKYFEKIFENELNEKDINNEEFLNNKNKNEFYSFNNNNDAFNFLFSMFSYFNLIIYSLYDCVISFSEFSKYFLYQVEISFFTIIFILGLVLSFDTNTNSNIPTNLIISAYFYKKNYTRITYEQIVENEKKGITIIKENEEDINIFTFDKILISCLCLFGVFLIIKLTINSRIKNFVFINSIGMYASFKLVKYLYKDKNYFGSSFIFVLLIYFDKNLLDSIFIKIRFQRNDFEIFSRNLISYSITQFILKFLSLLNITCFSLFFSIYHYNFWLNYFINYLCILGSLSFIGNCLEQFAPFYLRPFKNIIIFIVGTFNILFSKLLFKRIISKEKISTDFYSLYLINDLFSAYCINFINNYIEYQYKYVLDISNINNNNFVNSHCILGKNLFWFSFIIISVSISYLGIFKQEFILFIISLYTTKKYIIQFRQMYNIRISRSLNNLIIFNFFSYILILPKINDFYFLYIVKHITNLDDKILNFSFEFIYLLILIYYIITTNFILYIGYDGLQSGYNKENTSKFFNIILMIIEISIQFMIMCLIITIYKYYEKNKIINVLNSFCIVIYHLIKIASIDELKRNNEENINYNFYIFLWVIISLILIELSGPEISLIYIINHINLIFFINFYILNDKNNNIFKIIVIFFLLVDYYRLHSSLFIIDAIAIIIYPIIKNLKNTKKDKYYNYNERYRINIESIKAYNKLTFSFALFLLLFSLLEIG